MDYRRCFVCHCVICRHRQYIARRTVNSSHVRSTLCVLVPFERRPLFIDSIGGISVLGHNAKPERKVPCAHRKGVQCKRDAFVAVTALSNMHAYTERAYVWRHTTSLHTKQKDVRNMSGCGPGSGTRGSEKRCLHGRASCEAVP